MFIRTIIEEVTYGPFVIMEMLQRETSGKPMSMPILGTHRESDYIKPVAVQTCTRMFTGCGSV